MKRMSQVLRKVRRERPYAENEGNGVPKQILLPLDSESESSNEAQPFLKWAGGKSRLLSKLDGHFPDTFRRYVEPFLGGGAVFFHVRANFPDVPAYLSDNNDELINCYKVVRDDPEGLMQELDRHARKFESCRKEYYYQVREDHNLESPIRKAARVIFLNKTCFNGLWRVNSRGKFNVPMGSARNPTFYDRENLIAASRALQGVDLVSQDFRQTISQTTSDDFVYIDPPYDPVSKTSYFTAYTKDEFGSAEQRELARLFHCAVLRGVNLVLSNSDTPRIRELYRRYQILSVSARRMISSQAAGRVLVPEVVVLGFTKDQIMKMVNNSVRAWLVQNHYVDVADKIDDVLSKWERQGKKTRRNWWDVLAGSKDGRAVRIEGTLFPVLRAARKRKGWPDSDGSLSRNAREKAPPVIEQVRWKTRKSRARAKERKR